MYGRQTDRRQSLRHVTQQLHAAGAQAQHCRRHDAANDDKQTDRSIPQKDFAEARDMVGKALAQEDMLRMALEAQPLGKQQHPKDSDRAMQRGGQSAATRAVCRCKT